MSCWLPELIVYEPNKETWEKYEAKLYGVFHRDFMASKPVFNKLPVKHKRYPEEHNKPEAFFHVTCQDYKGDNDRLPDLRRCERIRWIKEFILNYNCNKTECIDCNGVKCWTSQKYRLPRIHILLEQENYVVVLEKRNNYYLLITAFYIDQAHKMDSLLKDFEKAKSAMH